MTIDQVTLEIFVALVEQGLVPSHAIYCHGTEQLTIHGRIDNKLKNRIWLIAGRVQMGTYESPKKS